MNMSIEYPQSRIKSSGQCDKCKGIPGFMKTSGYFETQDPSGQAKKLFTWTCNKCGYTMLFDISVARTVPIDTDQYKEVLPD